MDRRAPGPTIISQIGINVVSPDGTGTINNYLLIYVTNNPALTEALGFFGVPAHYDPNITYEYTRNHVGNGGVLYGAVPDGGIPAYFLMGRKPNRRQIVSSYSSPIGGLALL